MLTTCPLNGIQAKLILVILTKIVNEIIALRVKFWNESLIMHYNLNINKFIF